MPILYQSLDSQDRAPRSGRSGVMQAAPPPSSVPSARPSSSASQFVAAVSGELRVYVSEMNATAILSACAASARVSRDQLGPEHLSLIIAQVQASFDFFGVTKERRSQCVVRIRGLASAWPDPTETDEQRRIHVEEEHDIVRARIAGKGLCQQLGFSEVATTKVVTAISELSRNVFKYAQRGVVDIRHFRGERAGIEVVVRDRGPGIPDVEAVLRPGFRSRTGMGAGLRGTRALMDFFEVVSRPGEGTVVTIRKLVA